MLLLTSTSLKLHGFGYLTLLGEMMYAYVTCCPGIGYAITTMSKFLTKPSQAYYELSEGIAQYLCEKRYWGIKYKFSVDRDNLVPATLASDVILDENLPPFPIDIN